jgi:hypothetical protein
MTPERWKRVRELFEAAVERRPDKRTAFLDEACSGDASLREDVEALLSSDRAAGSFIEHPPAWAAVGSEGAAAPLAAGLRLGPYEIETLVGSGGMGEVYRARDARLGRAVAVKVLPSGAARDPERLRRFEQEARAAGILNHPNILAVYDVGSHAGVPYLVSELLEGETVRERLRAGTPLPTTKAVQYAMQAARGLAAAHEKGIVHRDLKPENLFVTKGGHVKILDFGLAKLIQASPTSVETAPRLEQTEPGTVMGTAGYMSPEQVRGETLDPRSDVFSLGCILYEMLSGRRAFGGASAAETMSAILREEPPDLPLATPSARELGRVVAHCLEKTREERFQSARDVVFSLESLASESGGRPPVAAQGTSPAPARVAVGVLALLAVAGAAYLLGVRLGASPVPEFRQLTFRRGTVESARFSPDGNSVLYGASWEGRPAELYAMRLDGLESRGLGLAPARLLATAPGEMAVLLRDGKDAGTLARLPLEGGTPREVLEDVSDADWSRDASVFAVVRARAGGMRLEFPVGSTVFETAGSIVTPRVAPDGKRVAFADRPMLGNTPGAIVVVDAAGDRRTLSEGWSDTGGVAWSTDGEEVWFTAARQGTARGLHAVTLDGRYRLVARTPGAMILQDISRGRVLLTHTHQRSEALARLAGDAGERDLSWLDWTHPSDLSDDGRTLLFTAEGEGGGPLYSVYLRQGFDAPPVRLGDGHATELSPDGAWAIALARTAPPEIRLLPTGPGQVRVLQRAEGLVELHWAWWLPSGERILFLGNRAGKAAQLFVQRVPDGVPQALAGEGVSAYRHRPISPDGRHVVVLSPGPPEPRFVLYPFEGGEPRPLPGVIAGDQPLRFTPDGRGLWVRAASNTALPVRIDRVDLADGRRTRWMELAPDDGAGVDHMGDLVLSRDGQSAVMSCARTLSDLYVVEGLE